MSLTALNNLDLSYGSVTVETALIKTTTTKLLNLQRELIVVKPQIKMTTQAAEKLICCLQSIQPIQSQLSCI
ncbi:hypothetical protein BZZ01_06895 [Nostocales cyanobacterium HT-58-2]|nr:hypothetical protein BZZ01_06895 [Nostocales cyanobacterium HT-58-2]